MTVQTKRIALYARVSTRDKGQDVENQLQQLRQFCVKQDWQVVAEYIDHASGKRSDRDALQKMFTAASQRQFDVLLFWSLDRLSREGVLETLNYLQRLTSFGVGYRSFTEAYLDSLGAFKDAVLAILACIAKQERIRLSERVLAGLDRARRAGRTLGRPSIADETRTEALKMKKDGFTLRQIAGELGISKRSASRLTA